MSRRSRQPLLSAGTLAFLLLAGACSSGSNATGSTTPPPPPAPTAGWLTVQLETPNSNDGAVQLLVGGPKVDSVRVVGFDGYSAVVNGQANVLVTGTIGNGNVAQVRIPDLSRASEYYASIVAAAARSSYQLQNLTGYRVVLVR